MIKRYVQIALRKELIIDLFAERLGANLYAPWTTRTAAAKNCVIVPTVTKISTVVQKKSQKKADTIYFYFRYVILHRIFLF